MSIHGLFVDIIYKMIMWEFEVEHFDKKKLLDKTLMSEFLILMLWEKKKKRKEKRKQQKHAFNNVLLFASVAYLF